MAKKKGKGQGRYLGRLCDRKRCPSMGEDERLRARAALPRAMLRALAREKHCLVPGCGGPRHLKQHDPEYLDRARLEGAAAAGVVPFARPGRAAQAGSDTGS